MGGGGTCRARHNRRRRNVGRGAGRLGNGWKAGGGAAGNAIGHTHCGGHAAAVRGCCGAATGAGAPHCSRRPARALGQAVGIGLRPAGTFGPPTILQYAGTVQLRLRHRALPEAASHQHVSLFYCIWGILLVCYLELGMIRSRF